MPICELSTRNGSIPTEAVRCATHTIVAWQSSFLFSKRLVNPYEQEKGRRSATLFAAGMERILGVAYPGGRHEMLHETNRRDVITNLLAWISGIF
jgi:hypothetical protein